MDEETIIIDIDQNDESISSSTASSSTTQSYINSVNININREDDIEISNIQEENSLIQYTEEHFINKLPTYIENDGIELQLIRSNMHFSSDSPVSMSSANSEDENEEHPHQYKKLTYDDVEKTISNYHANENKYNSEMDILITYLKGQKILYKYSNRITTWKLNALTIPSIFLTAILAIFTPFIERFTWGIIFIATLNGFITLFISLINYLKLESSAEFYLHIANQYDKLETSVEFTNNKIAFIENEKEQKNLVLKKINELERKLTEIKELNNVLIPNELKKLFPVIFHINVFSFIKKIELSKKKLIMKLKDVKNEMKYILYKWNQSSHREYLEKSREKHRMDYLFKMKEKMKEEISYYNNAYSCLDTIFANETYYVEKHNLFLSLFFSKKKNNYDDIKLQNPVINNHLKFILDDL